ncbi:MAG: hypothetical protein OEZ16_12025 [Chromatiales bacterium]|nr:hypothetical protein [Chromatiales bacterium]
MSPHHPIHRLLGVLLLTLMVAATPVMASLHLSMGATDMVACMDHDHEQHGGSEQGQPMSHCEPNDTCGSHGCSVCGAVQPGHSVSAQVGNIPALHYLHSHIDYLSSPPERPPRA